MTARMRGCVRAQGHPATTFDEEQPPEACMEYLVVGRARPAAAGPALGLRLKRWGAVLETRRPCRAATWSG